MYYFYDATYILVIIGAIISLIASMNVKSTFNRYDKYNSRSGLTGAMAAQEILRAAGITNVRIERVSGNLTDHYSPKEGVLRLSDSVYNSTSVAAIGVAAHECGHAMQYDEEYFPIKIRAAVIPIVICTQNPGHIDYCSGSTHGCYPIFNGRHPFCFCLNSFIIVVFYVFFNSY